jgi:hypothetical protein
MGSTLALGAGELGMQVLRSLARMAGSGGLAVLLRLATMDSPGPSRKRAELDELRALGVGFLRGDIRACSGSELTTLFQPFETVISCMGFAAGKDIQLKIARAVLEANVRRSFPWQFGVDYDVIGRNSAQDPFDIQLDVRDLLRRQEKTKWVIVSTGMFTSVLFEKTFGVADLDQPAVRALGGWDNSVTVTTPEDIGALTADIVFARQPKFKNEVVYTAGDTVSYGCLVDIVERVLGSKVAREVWSVPRLKQDLPGDPKNAIIKYRLVFAEGRVSTGQLSRPSNGGVTSRWSTSRLG